ncbi:Alanine--tRNA ligase, partial [Clarias magur]
AHASDAPARPDGALTSPAGRLVGGRGGGRRDQQQLCSTSHESDERSEQLKCLK